MPQLFTDILDPNQVKHTSVGDFKGERVKYRFLAANTAYAIPHKGNKMPTGYKKVGFVSTNAGAPATTPDLRHEYTDKIRWNKSVILLRATEAGDYEIEVDYGNS